LHDTKLPAIEESTSSQSTCFWDSCGKIERTESGFLDKEMLDPEFAPKLKNGLRGGEPISTIVEVPLAAECRFSFDVIDNLYSLDP
jgi:hypothetical protein